MEKKDLKPAGVFKYFEEICQVPRPSKKEEKMIAYLKAFGAKHNLETKVDEAGNVLIKKPATPGKENLQTVVLQSHIDMVCEKNNDVQHDFLTTPIDGLRLASSSSFNSLTPVGISKLSLSSSMQNKILKALPKTVTAFDALNRPFEYSTENLVNTTHASNANLRNAVSRLAIVT